MAKNKVCPECRKTGHDSKGDHLFLMSSGDKWCCNHAMYHESGLNYYEVEGEIPAVSLGTKVYEDIMCEYRGIPADIYGFYGFRGVYRESDDELTKIVWDMYEGERIVGQKWRGLPKDFGTTSGLSGRKLEFCGQHKYREGGKRLLIVEGEQDMCAAKFMIGSKYHCSVVSLPIGADVKALNVFKDQKKWLKKWKEIVICFDEDESGTETTRLVYGLIEDILVMDMSEKDANDMLLEGKEAEFIDAYFKAEKWKPSSMVDIRKLITSAVTPVEWGLSYPFEELTKITYGSRGGQIICIVGAPGSGKSTFVQQVQEHFMSYHKKSIAIFDLENPPELTLRKAIGSKMGKPIHLPDCIYDVKEATRIAEEYADYLHIYNHEGYRDWPDILMYMRYMHSIGVHIFFIDPLSALTTHLSSADANTYISTAMMDMSKFVQANKDVRIYHTNHANNGTGKDAGAGGRIYGGQITGSRSQWRFSTGVLSVERDQTDEDEDVRNSVIIRSIKDRMSGNTGFFNLVYDKDKGKLVEPLLKF